MTTACERKNAAAWGRNDQELVLARRQLEEVASAASHDLREPLRMINLYTQYLISEYGDGLDGQGREFARRIQDNVYRMERLIQGMSQYSGGLFGGVGNQLCAVPLRKAAVQALQGFRSRLGVTRAHVEVHRLPVIKGDQKQLEIVFRNLFSNSLKYAHPGRTLKIRIWARRQGRIWTIYFSDNGIGFKPEFSERIFGLFRRLHGRDVPGTGLGLAMCRQIIERHGGEIRAEGQPEQGSTFIFTLEGVSRHGARVTNITCGGQSRRRFSVRRSPESVRHFS